MLLSKDCTTLIHVTNQDIESNGFFRIPEGVTSIDNYAFYDCTNLKQIIIPDCVTSIGKKAFEGCRSLEQICIPEGVTLINEGVFWGCKNLKQIHIPGSVTTIDKYAFQGCKNLEQVHLPESLKSLGPFAFYNCNNLKQIRIPDSVTEIRGLFNRCANLKEIRISENLISIAKGTFIRCSSLETIAINSSDESKKEKICQLLPEELKNKVVLNSEEPYHNLVKHELNRLRNTPEIYPFYRYVNWDTDCFWWATPELIVYISRQDIANPYYRKACQQIENVPWPLIKEGEKKFCSYAEEIKRIVDNCIAKAIEFKGPPPPLDKRYSLSFFSPDSDSTNEHKRGADLHSKTYSFSGG